MLLLLIIYVGFRVCWFAYSFPIESLISHILTVEKFFHSAQWYTENWNEFSLRAIFHTILSDC